MSFLSSLHEYLKIEGPSMLEFYFFFKEKQTIIVVYFINPNRYCNH